MEEKEMTEKEREEEELRDKRIEAQDKQILVKIKELTDLINDYEGWKAEPARFACVELAIWGGEGSSEMYGILAEAQMQMREMYLDDQREKEEEAKQNENPPKEYKPPFISDAVN